MPSCCSSLYSVSAPCCLSHVLVMHADEGYPRPVQVRVAAALSRIAAQEEQSFDGGEERVNNWDKARREKERKEEGERLAHLCSTSCRSSKAGAWKMPRSGSA